MQAPQRALVHVSVLCVLRLRPAVLPAGPITACASLCGVLTRRRRGGVAGDGLASQSARQETAQVPGPCLRYARMLLCDCSAGDLCPLRLCSCCDLAPVWPCQEPGSLTSITQQVGGAGVASSRGSTRAAQAVRVTSRKPTYHRAKQARA